MLGVVVIWAGEIFPLSFVGVCWACKAVFQPRNVTKKGEKIVLRGIVNASVREKNIDWKIEKQVICYFRWNLLEKIENSRKRTKKLKQKKKISRNNSMNK